MSASSSLAGWLERIEQCHPEEIELGLERVATVANRMGLLPVQGTAITVAGTNGKGSTLAVLDALLVGAGSHTGRYTSPHLLQYNERVCLDGEPASDEALVAAFERVERARGDVDLTYFEFGTLAALDIFAGADVDYLLLEVGLGGRLDAVNIVDPAIAVVTSIALDHQSWLGETRDEIALEKAGVLRRGIRFVCADPEPPEALVERASLLGCQSRYVGRDFPAYEGAVSLRGENIAAAREVAAQLGVHVADGEFQQLLADLVVPGRQQRCLVNGVSVCLDVAHNPASVANCMDAWRSRPVEGRRVAVFAVLSDKDIHAMIRSCLALVDAWFVADLPGVPRAMSAATLAAALREQGETMVSENKNPKQAYRRAMSLLGPADELLVFGSFHTVAAVMRTVQRECDAP
jgi:dihydrofolate synthase/folylpolyglutamate synthase